MRKIVAALCAAIAGSVFAANEPSAGPHRAFAEYTGAGLIGNNKLDTGAFYWMHEGRGGFDGTIVGVVDEHSGFPATTAFGLPGVSDDAGLPAVGLEGADRANASFSGAVLSPRRTASNPGDPGRELGATIPEPQTAALMLAGLGAVAFLARRRRPD